MNDREAGTSGAVVTEDFDVFLNHRGPDVKATFVAHLEEALRRAGFRPFLEARSLIKGNPAFESMDQALDMAKVHVVVVSTRYAESKYCLNELVAIVRSRKPVVPVFYGVEPGNLRCVENGPFAEAFERHKLKGRSEKMQEWTEALAKLAEITGFCLADYRSDESELKRKVVDQVARLISPHIPVEVDSCRVGLEGPVSSCTEVLEKMGSTGVGILGLVGMGGIGKTTLAREIYNYYAVQIKFRHMSFLEIHRDDNPASFSDARVRLRKQLLWDLLRVETNGSTDYRNWFGKLSTVGPVMIVVDDVHNLDQYKALIPFATDLHSGSHIIVTSRDLSILNNVGGRARVDLYIFEVALLDSDDSNMLFNSHSFHANEALEEFRDLANDIVAACGGVPLALKVIGSSLFDKRSREDRETIWVEAGDAMRRSRDVMDVLRWSYDILPEAEERMFVDITCLFNNESREAALSFWRSCEKCVSCAGVVAPHTSLQNLIDKSLVSCNVFAKLKAHDLLMELGQEIGKLNGTHFVKGNNGEAALKRKNGSTITMALNLRESKRPRFEVEEFANMPNLHFLELPNGGMMDGDWRCMSKELRWLRWRNTSLTHVPSDLDLSHVTSLDFSASSTLVALWSKSECSLKGCPNLVRLNLSNCASITKLPDSIGQSPQLQDLNLWVCKRLKKLPETIGQLKKLQKLNLGYCERLKILPDTVGQLKQLLELNLCNCKSLKALPDLIGQASGLQILNLRECMKLKRLPESIGLLKELKKLILNSCASLIALPDSIGGLTSLRRLEAFYCTSLTVLSPSIQFCSSLETLYLEASMECQIFLVGPTWQVWRELTDLRVRNSHGLASLLDYGAFKSLSFLEVKDKTLTKFPESIGLLVTLCHLNIICERLQCLPNSFGDLKELGCLRLNCGDNLKRLPKTLGGLTNLGILCISNCGLLRKLPSSIGLLSRLEYLSINRCKTMKKLPTSFTQLNNVREFLIIDCGSILAMEALTTVQGMASLWGSTSITTLPPSLGIVSNLEIEPIPKRGNPYVCSIGEPFPGTCRVLEEDETHESGCLKAYHDESTGLLSLYRGVYYDETDE